MNKLIISASPHIHGRASTRSIMRDVLIALAPAFVVSVLVYGRPVVVLTAIGVAACVLFEWVITRFVLRRENSVKDLSAVVTGVLLSFNVPTSLPIWMLILGALVAVGVGKMSFGGLGRNPFNPALVGRVFLLLSFPVAMTTFPAPDGVSGATPLAAVKAAFKSGGAMPEFDHLNLFFGNHAGSLGEMAAGALLLGFVYLLYRRVIGWSIPVFVLGTIFAFTGLLHLANPAMYADPVFHILAGGAMLGAIFMATDYSTSPMTKGGMVVYAVGIGIITVLIRVWGAYPEGMSFAILIMNAVVPLLNKWMKPRLFGAK